MMRFICCVFLGASTVLQSPASAQTVDFNRDIRPILSKNCFPCHGQDASHRVTRLRLDQRDSATKVQKSGITAIVPGKRQESEVVRRITAQDETDHMPPKESGKP